MSLEHAKAPHIGVTLGYAAHLPQPCCDFLKPSSKGGSTLIESCFVLLTGKKDQEDEFTNIIESVVKNAEEAGNFETEFVQSTIFNNTSKDPDVSFCCQYVNVSSTGRAGHLYPSFE